MSKIFTSFLLLVALLSLSIIAKAANVDVLAANQTANMLADLKTFAPPQEQTKNVPEKAPTTISPDRTAISAAKVKGVIFEGESYKFRETSTLESMTFALICIGFIGLLAARRFKRAFV
jgi:hypothetical protein